MTANSKEYMKAYRKKNPDTRTTESRRNEMYKRKYGITEADFNKMNEAQRGKCAICGNGCTVHSRLSVDHCHDTGDIRGLLCFKCNAGIGKLNDNAELVYAAAVYLEGGIK